MKDKKLPEIRIVYGWHLDRIFKDLNERSKRSGPYPTHEIILKRIEKYKKAWSGHEKKILRGMTKFLELDFYQNVIDVYVVGYSPSFSNPLVISSHFQPDYFVDVLTHELIHRVLTDNTKKLEVVKIWRKMYPDEANLVRNHMLVHAVHKYIFLNILKEPSRLKREIRGLKRKTGYKRSWELVEGSDYLEIVEQFKKLYQHK